MIEGNVSVVDEIAAQMREASQASSPRPAPPLPAGVTPPPREDAEFAMLLLLALSNMAERSKRRQADLVAALRGAGMIAEPRRVRAALRLLQAQGAIDKMVPLSDGGLLLSVVPSAAARFTISEWMPRDDGDSAEV